MISKSTRPESSFPLDLLHKAIFSGQTMKKRNNLRTTLTSVLTQLAYVHTDMEGRIS